MRRKEIALADLREHERDLRQEKSVPADDVRREWEGVLRGVRAAMIAVTSRVRAQLPHLTAHDAAIMDAEIRAALTACGEDRAEAYADGR